MPLVSVVMPFHNNERFLDEAIQSILKQTFWDFEFIIINDRSTDRSDSVVKKYLNDSRIKYVNKYDGDGGQVYSTNLGIKLSQTKYIAIMHGDDISLPERLAKQYEHLCNNPTVDILGTSAYMINYQGKKERLVKKPLSNEAIRKVIFKFVPLVHPSVMFKKSIFWKIGLYNESLSRAPDYELWIRAIYSGAVINNLPEPLLLYRIHAQQLSARQREGSIVVHRIISRAIKKYDLTVSLIDKLYIYGHLIIGVLFPKWVSNLIEKYYKKIIQ